MTLFHREGLSGSQWQPLTRLFPHNQRTILLLDKPPPERARVTSTLTPSATSAPASAPSSTTTWTTPAAFPSAPQLFQVFPVPASRSARVKEKERVRHPPSTRQPSHPGATWSSCGSCELGSAASGASPVLRSPAIPRLRQTPSGEQNRPRVAADATAAPAPPSPSRSGGSPATHQRFGRARTGAIPSSRTQFCSPRGRKHRGGRV